MFAKIKKTIITFGKLLIESTSDNPKRKFFQYLAYFIILIVMNVLVGKNIGNTRYPWYSNVSIFLLVNINVILMLVLMLVIFRNLAKLLSDAHSNIFGSRLKFKLVIFSVAITVMPVAVVFFFASTLINDSINKWFNTQVDSALASSVVLMEDYRNMVRTDLFEQTSLISQVITDRRLYRASEKAGLTDLISRYVGKNIIMGISIYNRAGKDIVRQDSSNNGFLSAISSKYLDSVLKGNEETGYDFFDNAQVYWVGMPIVGSGNQSSKVFGALFTYKVTPKKIADDIDIIQDSRDKYRESEFFSYPVKKSYFMLLVMMSMLVVFAGIWGSILFARGITKPIEALADASVEISRGNLDVSVQEQGGDEISYLIRTFNRMAKLLSVHTKELHTKNEILSEMYNQISRDNMYIDAIFKNVDSALILLSHDAKVLKTNAKADILLSNNMANIDEAIKDDLVSFASSKEVDYFKNIELVFNEETRVFSLSLSKISSADEEQMLLVIADVTDIVNAQRVSVWKEVATRIAHEIKNPLTPIKLVAERVKKRSNEVGDQNLREVIVESMGTIVNEADNLLELVEEFNLFARLPKTRKFPIEITSLVNEALSLYTETYPNIGFNVINGDGLIVNGDRRQLKRVFQNLISNAICAMSHGGSITISSSEIEDSSIRIDIKDTGSGIKQEDIFKIFDPYFSKRSGGTGLGLAIVKKIIEEHSGNISVESSSEGTTFTIILPRGE